jgi:hypothetical protein
MGMVLVTNIYNLLTEILILLHKTWIFSKTPNLLYVCMRNYCSNSYAHYHWHKSWFSVLHVPSVLSNITGHTTTYSEKLLLILTIKIYTHSLKVNLYLEYSLYLHSYHKEQANFNIHDFNYLVIEIDFLFRESNCEAD